MRPRGMTGEAALLFVPIGDNPARPFGLGARERACRLARMVGLTPAVAADPGQPALLASMAFAFDPAWLDHLINRPNAVLTLAGKPVIVNVGQGGDVDAAARAVENGVVPDAFDQLEAETAALKGRAPGKGKRPFLLPLDRQSLPIVEKASYDCAFRQPSDFLTLSLLRRGGFTLTRAAARAGVPVTAVSLAGAVACLFAFLLFWRGDYWPGIIAGLLFMLLDTIAGALACCIACSRGLGSALRRGIDILHPPFWWWACLHGLSSYGRALEPVYATMVLFVILGGYLGELVIEVVALRRSGGMEIHAWRPVDSKFRLITAGRSSNMAILAVSLLLARPDAGLAALALWTLISLLFHSLRLAQMTERKARGGAISSWLEA